MRLLFLIVLSGVLFAACKKSSADNGGCFAGIKLTPTDSVPHAGDTVSIYANVPKLLYQWSGPDNYTSNGFTDANFITIQGIQIHQTGWYYCGASVPGCNPHSDSVYIRVQYQQGKPPCSLTDGTISNTAGIPDFAGASVAKYYDGGVTVSAYGGIGYPEYYFVFNSYNGNTEPQDGIYYTTSIPAFDPLQDADVVNMNVVDDFYYFTSDDGQKIYVSHVNGKLRISFCGIRADDSSGANGLFSGQITVP